jgi:hypothetical protein
VYPLFHQKVSVIHGLTDLLRFLAELGHQSGHQLDTTYEPHFRMPAGLPDDLGDQVTDQFSLLRKSADGVVVSTPVTVLKFSDQLRRLPEPRLRYPRNRGLPGCCDFFPFAPRAAASA